MRDRSRAWRRPSPSFVISCIALFVALSASAIALPGKNTVESDDIKPDVVTSQDLAQDSVTFSELANDAVNSSAILDGAVNSDQLGLVEEIEGDVKALNQAETGYAIATCPAGVHGPRQAVSGGFRHLFGAVRILDTQMTPDGFYVRGEGQAPSGGSIFALVYCLDG